MPQAAAEAVGKKIAELCKSKNIETVSFDRGGFIYHGRVQVCCACVYGGVLVLVCQPVPVWSGREGHAKTACKT